jgi:hypothetical protein
MCDGASGQAHLAAAAEDATGHGHQITTPCILAGQQLTRPGGNPPISPAVAAKEQFGAA